MDVDYSDMIISEDPYFALSHQVATTTFLKGSPSSSISLCNDIGNDRSCDSNICTGIIQLTDEQKIALTKIEDIFEAVTECLIDGKKELTIDLKSRPRGRVLDYYHGQDHTVENSTTSRILRFPGKTIKQARKFTIVLRILGFSHEALTTGVCTTKRDIYYKDTALFRSQDTVDQNVDDIAYTFGVTRDALKITAAAKGLVVGGFCILREDEEVVDYANEFDSMLVPDTKAIQAVDLSQLKWILVIEKEATFRHLATSSFWKDSPAGIGMLITAKGYPDIQTRAFLHLLSHQNYVPPIYALVDFDPDGIGILSTYKLGSRNLAHENKQLTCPGLQWLGIKSADIFDCEPGNDSYGLLKLTTRDRRVARRILKTGREEAPWKRELQLMLMLNIKAEIQIMGNNDALRQWLGGKLCAEGGSL